MLRASLSQGSGNPYWNSTSAGTLQISWQWLSRVDTTSTSLSLGLQINFLRSKIKKWFCQTLAILSHTLRKILENLSDWSPSKIRTFWPSSGSYHTSKKISRLSLSVTTHSCSAMRGKIPSWATWNLKASPMNFQREATTNFGASQTFMWTFPWLKKAWTTTSKLWKLSSNTPRKSRRPVLKNTSTKRITT